MRFALAPLTAALMAAVLLSACAPTRIRPDQALLAAQDARENQLAGRADWVIHARLGVSDGDHGGSGTLIWSQQGQTYDFLLTAPVTGRSFQLAGDAHSATLKGLQQGTLHGASAQPLLLQALGWQVPMAELRYWVRGMRAPGSSAQLLFGDDRLPSLLSQGGWKVEFRDWYADASPAVPRKVFAERGNYRVRVLINNWDFR